MPTISRRPRGFSTRTTAASNPPTLAKPLSVRRKCTPTGKQCSQGIPDFHAELLRSVDDGDTTWSEWAWSGNRVDGRDFQLCGATLLEVKSGQITAGRLYMEDVDRAGVGIEEAVQALSGQRPDVPEG